MNNNDKDLEAALDDIFGSDFIEIDVNSESKVSNDQETKSNENTETSSSTSKNDDFVTYPNENLYNNVTDELILQTDVNKEENNNINKIPSTYDNIVNEKNNKKEKNNNGIKIFIWSLLGFILGILVIYMIINYGFGVTKTINCSSTAEDEGYKYTDEYKITYKKDEIDFIESTYTYTALTDEFKTQIEYIKNDKLLPVINSNGMPGFTYVYEISDNYFKVNSYLDFNLIKFDEIDKIDQEQKPISNIKINSKITYITLKHNLEKQGYKCVPSK